MPRWVHGADLVVVSTPRAMVTLGVFGPTRLHLGPFYLSISSFPRLIVILLVTLTSRHFLVPKPTIVARAIDAFSRLRCSTTTRAVMPAVVSTRLAVFGGQRLRQTLCGTRCSTGRLHHPYLPQTERFTPRLWRIQYLPGATRARIRAAMADREAARGRPRPHEWDPTGQPPAHLNQRSPRPLSPPGAGAAFGPVGGLGFG